jgi:hypothetical protein
VQDALDGLMRPLWLRRALIENADTEPLGLGGEIAGYAGAQEHEDA